MLSVIIPTYNETGNIAKLINYLLINSKKEEIEIEIIIVDGGSVDLTLQEAKKAGGTAQGEHSAPANGWRSGRSRERRGCKSGNKGTRNLGDPKRESLNVGSQRAILVGVDFGRAKAFDATLDELALLASLS